MMNAINSIPNIILYSDWTIIWMYILIIVSFLSPIFIGLEQQRMLQDEKNYGFYEYLEKVYNPKWSREFKEAYFSLYIIIAFLSYFFVIPYFFKLIYRIINFGINRGGMDTDAMDSINILLSTLGAIIIIPILCGLFLYWIVYANFRAIMAFTTNELVEIQNKKKLKEEYNRENEARKARNERFKAEAAKKRKKYYLVNNDLFKVIFIILIITYVASYIARSLAP